MENLIGAIEFVIFAYLALRALSRTSRIVDAAIFNFMCSVFNSKFFGSLPMATIGPISLYSSDIFILLLLTIIIYRRYVVIQSTFPSIGMTVFSFVALLACIMGLVKFGPSSDFFYDLRKYMYFAISVWFFSFGKVYYNWNQIEKKLDKLFTVISIYIVILLIFHFMGIRVGFYEDDRPLLSDYAIIYAAYIAYCWYKDLILSTLGAIRIKTILMTVLLILNRFNTTWVALLVGVAVIFLFLRVEKKRHLLKPIFWLEVAGIAVVIVGILTMYQGNAVMSELWENMQKFDLSGHNTLTSRIELWGTILATYVGVNLWIGFPFGNGYHVAYRGTIWQFQPHNGYIELVGRVGLIGLVAILCVAIWIIYTSIKRKTVLPISILMVMLVYWVAYSITLEQGILMGICIMYLQNAISSR